jgi:Kdo2-lipid IVA lauroyltransferase/acyltransferase
MAVCSPPLLPLTATVPVLPRPYRWLAVLACLPLAWLRWAGALFGWVLWVFAVQRRRVVVRNLALCFPDLSARAQRRLVQEVFVRFGQAFVDRVWLWHGTPAQHRQRLQLSGDLSVLQQAGPVLVFAPHFVGLDAAWSALSARIDRDWMTLYSPQIRPALDRWVRQGRQRVGRVQLVARRQGIRPLVKGLREGAALYLLPDMDLGPRNAVFAPFFGHPAATVTSLPRLAGLAGAPVVPVLARLTPQGYAIEVLPPWAGYPGGDDAADAATMNERLEGYIRSMPGQYHWLHRRFKTRPPGEASLYR